MQQGRRVLGHERGRAQTSSGDQTHLASQRTTAQILHTLVVNGHPIAQRQCFRGLTEKLDAIELGVDQVPVRRWTEGCEHQSRQTASGAEIHCNVGAQNTNSLAKGEAVGDVISDWALADPTETLCSFELRAQLRSGQ